MEKKLRKNSFKYMTGLDWIIDCVDNQYYASSKISN